MVISRCFGTYAASATPSSGTVETQTVGGFSYAPHLEGGLPHMGLQVPFGDGLFECVTTDYPLFVPERLGNVLKTS
jgi:hypothetical protein